MQSSEAAAVDSSRSLLTVLHILAQVELKSDGGITSEKLAG
jgi:hypothetical protein